MFLFLGVRLQVSSARNSSNDKCSGNGCSRDEVVVVVDVLLAVVEVVVVVVAVVVVVILA